MNQFEVENQQFHAIQQHIIYCKDPVMRCAICAKVFGTMRRPESVIQARADYFRERRRKEEKP